MDISMYILADHLREYHPIVRIHEGGMTLSRCRILTDQQEKREQSTVYICASGEYIPTLDPGIICSNGRDYIYLPSTDVQHIFNRILDIFEQYNALAEQLFQLIMARCSIQRLLDQCGRILPLPMVFCNSGHMICAQTNCEAFELNENPVYLFAKSNRFIPTELYEAVNADFICHYNDRKCFIIEKKHDQLFRTINHNIFYQNRNVGYLTGIIRGAEDETKGRRQLFEFIVPFLEKGYEDSGDLMQDQGQIFAQLLKGEAVEERYIRLQEQALGWESMGSKTLLILQPEEYKKNSIALIASRLIVRYPYSFILPYEEQVIMITQDKCREDRAFTREFRKLLRELHTYAGASYEFHELRELKKYYRQARLAIGYGSKRSGELNLCEDFMLDYVREVLKSQLSVDIWRDELRVLEQYDQEHKTEYLATLKTYLMEERSQTRTAQKMNIHRNTLVKRIQRIEELIRVDLDDTVTRTQLWLSCFVE